jgi:hypothetical protein
MTRTEAEEMLEEQLWRPGGDVAIVCTAHAARAALPDSRDWATRIDAADLAPASLRWSAAR